MRYGLSKSKIAAFEQCPKRLWLSVHKPHEMVISEATQAVFAAGHEVGSVACSLVPDGIMIKAEPDMASALSLTAQLVASPDPQPLFEATFRIHGVLVRVDIMEPLACGGWHLAEVKSTTRAKEYQISDLATQVWVMRECGVEVASAAVRHINTSFVLLEPGDYTGLFADVELSAAIEPIIAGRAEVAREALQTLEGPEPSVAVGNHCSSPFSCPFEGYCRRGLSEPRWPVSLLPRGRKIAELWAERGITELTELPEGALSNRLHVRIYEATRSGTPYHDAAGAARTTAAWTYPRTWLDFETISFAIPRWVGTRPYEQIPFQFSAHVENADGTVEHREFLSLDGNDPRRSCAESLIGMIPEEGAVIAYNASFERGCIEKLADALPELGPQLRSIAARVVDLLPVTQEHWYHPEQRGSWSIKAVLPTIGSELGYSDLDVKDGTAAQRAYLEAISPGISEERRLEIYRSLSAYCGLDSEAMIHLHRHLCPGSAPLPAELGTAG